MGLVRRAGASSTTITNIDPWFLDQISLARTRWRWRRRVRRHRAAELSPENCSGCAQAPTASPTSRSAAVHRPAPRTSGARVCGMRWGCGRCTRPIDTCAAEFAAKTPYHVLVLRHALRRRARLRAEGDGAARRSSSSARGPNRIGQGIEFDYSCVHATPATRCARPGTRPMMINCNPETVSTDYGHLRAGSTSSPSRLEDVLEVFHAEKSSAGPASLKGVIVQLGGQTPLGLAQALKDAGVPIVGTSPEAIHLAEDREARSSRVLARPAQPPGSLQARHRDELRRGGRAWWRPSVSGYPAAWCDRPTCWVVGGWRSSTTRRRSRTTCTAPCHR